MIGSSLSFQSRKCCRLWRICEKHFRSQKYVGNELLLQRYDFFGRASLLAALKACSSCRDLEAGRIVHRYAAESGEDSHIFVANTLVSMYAKCGSMTDAATVFNGIQVDRDVVSWNALVLGYAENGEEALALESLEEMQTQGCQPNARTCLAAIKACTSMAVKETVRRGVDGSLVKKESLQKGVNLHRRAILDVFVANSLVDMYAKCGSMVNSREVFDRMPGHTVVSWTSVILGYAENGEGELGLDMFSRMQAGGDCEPDSLTYVAALKACSSLAIKEEAQKVDGRYMKVRSLQKGMRIHSLAAKSACDADVFVASTLVDMYAKCGSLEHARMVFDKMRYHDTVSWTALMLGYGENGEGEVALKLFERMIKEGCLPDSLTFVAALTGCISLAAKETARDVDGKLVKLESLKKGTVIHSESEKRGCDSNIFVTNTLMDMYVKCGSMVDARRVFDRALHRDVVSWNALMMGYVESRDEELALELFEGMQLAGYSPDALTFVAAVKACVSLAQKEVGTSIDGKIMKVKLLEKGMALHSRAAKTGFDSNSFLACSFLELYAVCGSMLDARSVFDRTPNHDVVFWTALILGYAGNAEDELALSLYASMGDNGCFPDAQTFAAAFKACGSLVALEAGKAVHADTYKFGVETDRFLETSLLDLYGKCGKMVDAQLVFDSVSSTDPTTWTTLIAGYSRQGDAENVFGLFYEMQDEGFKADAITFVCVLSACSHAGLVNRGKKYFQLMLSKYGVRPSIDHYVCMVDIYGRANEFDTALTMLKSMPFEANAVTWRTVLGACVKWKNLVVGKHAFESLLMLNEKDSAAYSLMGNIYGSLGMWEEKVKVEAMKLEAQTKDFSKQIYDCVGRIII